MRSISCSNSMRIVLLFIYFFLFSKSSKGFVAFLKTNQFTPGKETNTDLIVRKWADTSTFQLTSLTNGNISSHIKNTAHMN